MGFVDGMSAWSCLFCFLNLESWLWRESYSSDHKRVELREASTMQSANRTYCNVCRSWTKRNCGENRRGGKMKMSIPAITLKVARSVSCFLFSFLHIFVGKEHHECPHPAHLCQRQRIVNLLPIVNIQLTLPEFFLLKFLQTKFLKSCSSPAVKAHKCILVQLSLPLSLLASYSYPGRTLCVWTTCKI